MPHRPRGIAPQIVARLAAVEGRHEVIAGEIHGDCRAEKPGGAGYEDDLRTGHWDAERAASNDSRWQIIAQLST
jgi:hypothetical protein